MVPNKENEMKQSIRIILYFAFLIFICITTFGATPSIVKQPLYKVQKIMIDPGFGGEESGPRSFCSTGNYSKDINLAISLKLAKLIRERLAIDVALTRDVDRTVSLDDRTALANNSNCDLFISIHCNAHEENQIYGIETYYLNIIPEKTSDIEVSHKKNKSNQNTSELLTILNDLMLNKKIKESKKLAFNIQNSLCHYLAGKYDMVNDRGIKQALFYVLIGTEMPSIIIETSFISNPRECKRLNSDKYQKDLCEGIVQGLEKYISNLNAKGVETTQLSY